MGQAAIAIAFGADGEFQRGRRDAGLPHGGGILPESSSGERKLTFIRFILLLAATGTQKYSESYMRNYKVEKNDQICYIILFSAKIF